MVFPRYDLHVLFLYPPEEYPNIVFEPVTQGQQSFFEGNSKLNFKLLQLLSFLHWTKLLLLYII